MTRLTSMLVIIVCTCAALVLATEAQPRISEKGLAQLIMTNVTNSCAKIDPINLSYASHLIAREAIRSGTNSARLEVELKEMFLGKDKSLAFLEPSKNRDCLTAAAKKIAADAFPDNSPEQSQSSKGTMENGNGTKGSNTWLLFSFWTGARVSNPYRINGTTLESAGSSTDGYIEFSLSGRYILRRGPKASDPVLAGFGIQKTPEDDDLHLVSPLRLPDWEARLGYVFSGSEPPDSFDANTVVGSSDFYVEFTSGVPFLRLASSDGTCKQQWTFELNGGFTTDKDTLDLHPIGFFGIGWQGSWMWGNGQIYCLGRAGYAVFDQPVLAPGTSTVVFNEFQKPAFDENWAPSMGINLVLPILPSISVQAGVNAYFTSQPPSSWNASVGMSLDIGKFFSALTK